MKQLTRVAIGLGSNLGDRESTIARALAELTEDFLMAARVSSLYESPPWGPIQDQGRFLNAVVAGDSEWKPPAILNYLKLLETRLGRVPGPKYGPRALDLDLLAYGEMPWEGDGLMVPHPRLTERDFVLLPLAEVWPEWRHPASGKSARELAADLSRTQRPSATVFAAPPQGKATP